MYLLLLLSAIALGTLPLVFFIFRALNQTTITRQATLDEELILEKSSTQKVDWWENHRGTFNWTIAFAGIIAFGIYTYLLPFLFVSMPNFDFGSNFLSILLPIMTYLIYMGVANVFYGLGPMFETKQPATNIKQYRSRLFLILCGIFAILPQVFAWFTFF